MSSISFNRFEYSGASPNVYLGNNDLSLNMRVNDVSLRNITGREHDGLERPFALVPTTDGGWKRMDLEYISTYNDRGGSANDSYSLNLGNPTNADVSLDRLHNEGVAFGLEISGAHGSNPTTVWLQHYGDNYRPYVW